MLVWVSKESFGTYVMELGDICNRSKRLCGKTVCKKFPKIKWHKIAYWFHRTFHHIAVMIPLFGHTLRGQLIFRLHFNRTGRLLRETDDIHCIDDHLVLPCITSFQSLPLLLLWSTNVTPVSEFTLLPREKLWAMTPSPVLGVFWLEESPLCQRAACWGFLQRSER